MFDNVSGEGDGTVWEEVQRIREASTFEKIFAKAELTIGDQEPPAILKEHDFPVKMWALY